MPLALDPNETFEVTLDADTGRDNPPRFVFHYLTCREWKAVAKVGDDREALEKQSSEQVLDCVYEAVCIGLVDWQGVVNRDGNPIPFSHASLLDVVTVGELWELYYSARRWGRLGSDDRKNSESPLPTSTDESVAAAPSAAMPVPTDPA